MADTARGQASGASGQDRQMHAKGTWQSDAPANDRTARQPEAVRFVEAALAFKPLQLLHARKGVCLAHSSP